jgi:TonB dependent receptor.
MDRWRPVDPAADLFSPDTQWISGWYPYTGGDHRRTGSNAVQDASYIRLKTLEFGYTLPKTITQKIKIKSMRVYVNGYNLATISNLPGLDPERPGSTNNVGTSTGTVDMYQYPNNKTYTVGVNIKF